MKTILLLPFGFLFLFSGKSKLYTENEHIKVKMEYSEKVSSAQKGELSFLLSPNAGIHVNTEPLFEILLDKDSHFTVNEEPVFSKNKEGYLAVTKPVLFTFSPKKGTAPGKYSLKGTLRYFFCSDAEGWCNRFSQPIDVTIEIGR
ncbi:MAG: hypothetical protein H3C35_10350 [Bacteroidetes bacterium]|nr:hypothetical protein [Bacteroidota bacterium]